MKKMISALFVVVFAVLAMAIPVQAQGRRGDIVDVIGSRVGGGGGYYNRGGYDRYGQDMQCRYDRYGRPYNCRRYDRRIGAWVPFAAGVIVGAVATAVANRQRPESIVQQVPYEAPVEMNAPQLQPVMSEVRSVSVANVNPEEEILWTTVNTTDFPVLVIDPNTGKKTLIPRHGSVELPSPSGPKAYEVKIISPGAGRNDVNPGQIKPSKDLLRWEISPME